MIVEPLERTTLKSDGPRAARVLGLQDFGVFFFEGWGYWILHSQVLGVLGLQGFGKFVEGFLEVTGFLIHGFFFDVFGWSRGLQKSQREATAPGPHGFFVPPRIFGVFWGFWELLDSSLKGFLRVLDEHEASGNNT